MKVIISNLNTHVNETLLSAFNWPIDEGSSFKFEHPYNSSHSRTFSWPIDEGSSFKFEHSHITSF
jgi:hypothetical protein